jgi:hypothetical protein
MARRHMQHRRERFLQNQRYQRAVLLVVSLALILAAGWLVRNYL